MTFNGFENIIIIIIVIKFVFIGAFFSVKFGLWIAKMGYCFNKN